MSVIDTLVFDRTRDDLEKLNEIKTRILTYGLSSLTSAEKTEYLSGMKGAYNYTDLNRVGQAVAYIADRLISLPGEISTYREAMGVSDNKLYRVPYDVAGVVVSPKTDWKVSDIPVRTQMEAYLKNVHALQGIFELPESSPDLSQTLEGLNLKVANAIERILYDVNTKLEEAEDNLYDLIDRTAAAFTYSGINYAE